MPAKNHDLHGNAPDDAPAALLLIDVINDMEYEGGERLLAQALPMAERLAALKRRAKAAGVPVIYANDNFGRWRRTSRARCAIAPRRASAAVRSRSCSPPPPRDDYFVLKPKHSAFFATPLDTLLNYLGAHTVLLTGIATDSCVLFTAVDGFLRDLELIAVEDCMVASDPQDHRDALRYMARVMDVAVQSAASIDLARLSHRHAA